MVMIRWGMGCANYQEGSCGLIGLKNSFFVYASVYKYKL